MHTRRHTREGAWDQIHIVAKNAKMTKASSEHINVQIMRTHTAVLCSVTSHNTTIVIVRLTTTLQVPLFCLRPSFHRSS